MAAENYDINETCKYFIDEHGHFFRQDKDKVLHVHEGIVNTLKANFIDFSRTRYNYRFEPIGEKRFNDYFYVQLNKFFE